MSNTRQPTGGSHGGGADRSTHAGKSDKNDRAERTDPRVLTLLVCPVTKSPLTYDEAAQELISEAAGLAFPIREGIPIMLVDQARQLDDRE